MAQDNQIITDPAADPAYGNSAAGMEKYRETAVAFDNLIVQVGQAIASAQQAMDENQVLFQRQVARAVQEGKLRRLEVPPMSAYTMPETTLYLKMGLSIDYSEKSTGPALSAVPLNAATTNQNDIDIESATEIRLRFVSVPQAQEPPGPAPSALTAAQVEEIVKKDERIVPLLPELEKLTLNVDYKEDSRLWIIVYLEAREARLVVVVDDRTGIVTAVIDKKLPPTDAELTPISAPTLERIEPARGKQGDILTIYGDNFLTLAGQTILSIQDRPIPIVRLSMKEMSFKVPGWDISGNIKITTPIGSVNLEAAYTPIPSFTGFQPDSGSFDVVKQRGSWFTVTGHNLRPGCVIEFASGARSKNIEYLSSGQMSVEVPAEAGTGPLTLVYEDYRQSLANIFFMLPRIDRISPRQARVGEIVALTGSNLAEVSQVLLGQTVVLHNEFTLHTAAEIRFMVPQDAADGQIRAGQAVPGTDKYCEAVSRDIFYVVPRITGFTQSVGIPGKLLTILGQGLDPNPEMMTIIFEARQGISEAPVLSAAPDRKSLVTRVPLDAAAGYVLLLRKKVFSDSSPLDTSDLSLNKLTILNLDGDASDLLLEDRFDKPVLAPERWVIEAGSWSIDGGMLAAAAGPARLRLADPLNLEQFSIYTDIIQAQRFGFSLMPTGGSTYIQVWIDLLAASPALTWTRIDTKGQQTYLDGIQLALLPGQNHLAQLNVKKVAVEETPYLEMTLLLDQEQVHTYRWSAVKAGTIAILSDSAVQRWDNVVILKGDYLSLPAPELYRFGEIPVIPPVPGLKITGFSPMKGGAGTKVAIDGEGFDAACRFFFSGVEAQSAEVSGTKASVLVPTGARSGPIEVQGRAGITVTSGELVFIVPPAITGLLPDACLAGQELRILGTNLPGEQDTFAVKVLDQPAIATAAFPTMLTVRAPQVSGTGKVTLSYEGFTAEAPRLLSVRQEEVLIDIIAKAENAAWAMSAGAVRFGILGESSADPAVQIRVSERLEDDRVYGPVLYIHPPAPDLRALRGVYPEITVPAGRIELRAGFGMLWTAAPAADEAADVDGVLFEITFKPADSAEEIVLLPRFTCVHDGCLERFVTDAAAIAGKKGRLVISVFAGRTGLRDDTAFVYGQLVSLT